MNIDTGALWGPIAVFIFGVPPSDSFPMVASFDIKKSINISFTWLTK